MLKMICFDDGIIEPINADLCERLDLYEYEDTFIFIVLCRI